MAVESCLNNMRNKYYLQRMPKSRLDCWLASMSKIVQEIWVQLSKKEIRITTLQISLSYTI